MRRSPLEPSLFVETCREVHWHFSRNWVSYLIQLITVLLVLAIYLFGTHFEHQ